MTNAQMVKAFNEWMRRFIEEPDRFEREFQTVSEYQKDVAEGREPTYGEVCAPYLQKLADELPAE